jgi:hypothetical protein
MLCATLETSKATARVTTLAASFAGTRTPCPCRDRDSPHALRHAFSVRFLEQHLGEIEALQRLLGHSKVETTQRYWRAMERMRLMERVRDLSWETRFESTGEKAPSGLEPLLSANRRFAGTS